MHYKALATDFDGTIAHDGVVDEPTLAALLRLKAAGVKLLLVTGRELAHFLELFPQFELFDRLVMENGAILYDLSTKQTTRLAPAPPEPFVARLRAANIPLSVGHSVVSTYDPHGQLVFDAVREMKLDWHVIRNKGAIMCLPAGVTKATGLLPALESLGISAAETVAAGDAENDHAMMRECGLAVAPSNALDCVKADADIVTIGERGDGMQELIARWLGQGLGDLRRRR